MDDAAGGFSARFAVRWVVRSALCWRPPHPPAGTFSPRGRRDSWRAARSLFPSPQRGEGGPKGSGATSCTGDEGAAHANANHQQTLLRHPNQLHPHSRLIPRRLPIGLIQRAPATKRLHLRPVTLRRRHMLRPRNHMSPSAAQDPVFDDSLVAPSAEAQRDRLLALVTPANRARIGRHPAGAGGAACGRIGTERTGCLGDIIPGRRKVGEFGQVDTSASQKCCRKPLQYRLPPLRDHTACWETSDDESRQAKSVMDAKSGVIVCGIAARRKWVSARKIDPGVATGRGVSACFLFRVQASG